MTSAPIPRSELDLPLVVVSLMKGVVYRDAHEKAWAHLLQLVPQVRDHVAVMGLTVEVSESEGYAFLRSLPDDPGADDNPPPRLVARRTLSFHVSLLLALLRKKLAEFDASNADTRLVLTRDQIVELVRVFVPTSTNDARVVEQIERTINKIIELGFLTRVKSQDNLFEVRRILKAFVDGQWLSDFDARLADYAAQLSADAVMP